MCSSLKLLKIGVKKGRRVGQRIICNSSAKEVLECSALRPRNGLCELDLRLCRPTTSVGQYY